MITYWQVHQRSAELLLKLFRFNKGIFIKFGQHLCALEVCSVHVEGVATFTEASELTANPLPQYILPWEYTQAMIPLQARAPTLPFHEIEKGISWSCAHNVLVYPALSRFFLYCSQLYSDPSRIREQA